MEDLLPLIIGIVWVVYSLYSRNQKKKAKAAGEPVSESRRKQPSILEQILSGQGITLPEPEVIDLEEPYIEPSVQEYKENRDDKRRYDRTPFLSEELQNITEEGQTGFEYHEAGSESFNPEFDYENSEGSQSIAEEFNLKKAVVYSEILNPPYIDYK
ncbi:MAG: hypothetical protein K9G76_12570 [Bacteroidales bacterium]|nr:hypothetical protein [Bacteroidales bacterium]MCF8405413.1 hypothetical protein [Bacteroidales bacterium]